MKRNIKWNGKENHRRNKTETVKIISAIGKKIKYNNENYIRRKKLKKIYNKEKKNHWIILVLYKEEVSGSLGMDLKYFLFISESSPKIETHGETYHEPCVTPDDAGSM